MSRGGRWIAGIVVLLVGNAAVMITLAATAGDPSSRVLPDYYRNALAYDEVAAARKASAALGWTSRISLVDDDLAVVLADRAGAPVTGVAVTVELRPTSRADERTTSTLPEVAPGVYRLRVSFARRGLHDVAVTGRRDDATFLAEGLVEP